MTTFFFWRMPELQDLMPILEAIRECINVSDAVVTVKPKKKTRSAEQNDMLHGLARQLERSKKLFAGKPRKTEAWKRILVASWLEESGRDVEIVPTISGKGVVQLGVQTAQMKVDDMSELLQFAEAYAYGGDV